MCRITYTSILDNCISSHSNNQNVLLQDFSVGMPFAVSSVPDTVLYHIPAVLSDASISQNVDDSYSLENVTSFRVFFCRAACADAMMSWVCNMLMFQVAM